MISITLFIAAVMCYSIKELALHGKLKWSGAGPSFWGPDSSRRKYQYINGVIRPERTNWYYKLFNIEYKERFPLSTTLLVSLTDGYHLMQLFFKVFLCLSIALYKPLFNIWWYNAILFWLIFGITFTVFYRVFSRAS